MEPSQPTSSRLENIPLDILEGICAHLDGSLGRLEKRSLAALASTSRRLRSAVSPFQFRTIEVHFIYYVDIAKEVERWKELLDARGCASHVRRLAIVEDDEPSDEWEDADPTPWPTEITEQDTFEPVGGREAWPLDRNDGFWTRLDSIRFTPWLSVPSPKEKARTQALWAPLAGLISSLPGLGNVDYQCRSQIPVNLLAALNGKVGGPVLLHMYSFSLRSLYQDKAHLHDIDEDEFYLATSPCLSSIRLLVPERGNKPQAVDGMHRVCFNEDAVAHMLRGLAPNLKSLTVDTFNTSARIREGEEVAWPGFFPSRPADNTSPTGARGALETLTVEHGAGELDDILAWAACTDFGALRSLHLRTYTVNVPFLNALSEMAESGELSSLRSLSLWTWPYWGPDGEDDGDIGDPEIARLLRAVPPLRSLELRGVFADEAFGAVLSSHGPTLRALRLFPERNFDIQPQPFVLSRGYVEALVRDCPGLTDLEILVPRSNGDEAEARIYRALAELRVLDRLSLLLDCSNIPAGAEHSDGDSEDRGPDQDPEEDSGKFSNQGSDGGWNEDSDKAVLGRGDRVFRDGIINLNTWDPTLTTDIFDALCLHRSPRLIRLYPVEMGNYGTEVREWSIIFIYKLLSRAWIRERDDREGHVGEARVTAVEAMGKTGIEREPLKVSFHGILESIWPEAGTWPEGGEEARKSFPLWKPS